MPLVDLLSRIHERIESEYEDPAEHVPYESAEGGYQWPTLSSDELLKREGLGFVGSNLFEAIKRSLPQDEWVRHNPSSLPLEDALKLSWYEFARLIQNEVRYLLFPHNSDDDSSEGPRPNEMLNELGELFVRYNLFSTLKRGKRLFRTRSHECRQVPQNTLEELGPPPEDLTKSNRMSPAGISMFYAALDEQTALMETYGNEECITIATFELIEDLYVLDLVKLPSIPSIYENDEDKIDKPYLIFIRNFVDDLTKPVVKDGHEHIDYVPSQVVTEYVRYQLVEKIDKPIRGILYESAKKPNGIGCVLFVPHDDCKANPPFRNSTKAPFELLTGLTHMIRINVDSQGIPDKV